MHEYILHLFTSLSLSPEATTFLLSMTPIGELRLGLPWGIEVYHFPWQKAFLIAFLGNNLINFILYFLGLPVANFFEKRNFWIFSRIVVAVRKYVHKKGEKYLEKWGGWAIFIISLIPLPGFGGWSGSLIAAFLGIEYKHAVPALVGGTFVAGCIVLASTLGIKNLL
jgi:uncharacterized membrane protein